MNKVFVALALLITTLGLGGCGYNTLQSSDEQVKSAWAEVVNQYQRRADLVPNLVNVVKGYAQQEKDVLLGVTNARAQRRQHAGDRLNWSTIRRHCKSSRQRKASCHPHSRVFWWSPKTILS